jgi:hypothetical protein
MSLAEVEVEPLVLPAGADAEVGGEPTAAVDAEPPVQEDGIEASKHVPKMFKSHV